MDPLSLLVGAGILLFGTALGSLLRRGRRTAATTTTTCEGCQHGLSYHADTGGCQGIDQRNKYNRHGDYIGKEPVSCTCQLYVGHIPADRMLRSWNPQLPSTHHEN